LHARLHAPGISAEPLILSVGRLCETKGLPFLIRACRILKDRGFQFQCRIVGSGELYSNLAALICELDVANCVSLCGRMVQNEVIPLYCSANVFVLPCLVTEDGDRDAIPNVLIEAMASGLFVILTRISLFPNWSMTWSTAFWLPSVTSGR
jgi:glycosyltransferase involved in cell wall biosynthesis